MLDNITYLLREEFRNGFRKEIQEKFRKEFPKECTFMMAHAATAAAEEVLGVHGLGDLCIISAICGS